jgi:hypothetical protein
MSSRYPPTFKEGVDVRFFGVDPMNPNMTFFPQKGMLKDPSDPEHSKLSYTTIITPSGKPNSANVNVNTKVVLFKEVGQRFEVPPMRPLDPNDPMDRLLWVGMWTLLEARKHCITDPVWLAHVRKHYSRKRVALSW